MVSLALLAAGADTADSADAAGNADASGSSVAATGAAANHIGNVTEGASVAIELPDCTVVDDSSVGAVSGGRDPASENVGGVTRGSEQPRVSMRVVLQSIIAVFLTVTRE